jgi:hypothetical protein
MFLDIFPQHIIFVSGSVYGLVLLPFHSLMLMGTLSLTIAPI